MKFTSQLRDTTCQWDHTVLSATRQRWPPRLHPSRHRAGWYSIYRIDPVRMKGWVGLVGWLRTEIVYPSTGGHPSWYWRSAAVLIEANALPLSQTANHYVADTQYFFTYFTVETKAYNVVFSHTVHLRLHLKMLYLFVWILWVSSTTSLQSWGCFFMSHPVL